jgi:hypothetical protein
LDPAALYVVLATAGPKAWLRIDRGEDPARRPVPATKVSNIDEENLKISFDVDEVGNPVLVKTSYFPNWAVKGADGPYRVTPNLMVVIPRSKHVELTYGYTKVEYLGYGASLVALLALIALVRRGPVTFPEPPPDPRDEDDDDPVASVLPEGAPEPDEPDDGPGDPSDDGGAGGPPLLDPDGELGHDEPAPLGP